MQIECKLKREGGSKVELGGILYHFLPLPDGAHVADVEREDHQDRFLSIAEGYRLYRGTEAAPPQEIQQQAKEDIAIALLGSSVHPATFDIGGKTLQLAEVVALAHIDSGLSAEDWNELSDEARADLIDEQLDKLDKLAADAGEPDTELNDLRAQYEAKFGKKPHPAMKADSIRAKLAE